MMEDEKLAALGLSDQLPSAQGLFQPTQSQSPFSVSQVWFHLDFPSMMQNGLIFVFTVYVSMWSAFHTNT